MPRDGFGKPWDGDRGSMRVMYGGPPDWARREWEIKRVAKELAKNGRCTVPGCFVCSGKLASRYPQGEP